MTSNTSWPPLDPDAPPEAHAVVTDARLRELRSALTAHVGDEDYVKLTIEQRELLTWLIDFARGFRLLRRAGAWSIAALAAVAGAAQAWDVIVKSIGK